MLANCSRHITSQSKKWPSENALPVIDCINSCLLQFANIVNRILYIELELTYKLTPSDLNDNS